MHTTKLSLAGKLDSGLNKGLCVLLRWLRTGMLWLMGLLTLASLKWIVFEYDEGLADLSLVEGGFILLFALLVWRHIQYCKYFITGFWRGLSRLLIFLGLMSTVGLALIGFLTPLLAQTEHLQAFLGYLLQDDPASKCATFTTILLTVYLAAPTAAIKNLSNPSVPDQVAAASPREACL